jgi:hypothetical protein
MSKEYEDGQRAIREAIAASPVVAVCLECEGDITQAEIDLGLANSRECAGCVYDEVRSMIGDY